MLARGSGSGNMKARRAGWEKRAMGLEGWWRLVSGLAAAGALGMKSVLEGGRLEPVLSRMKRWR
jgi:hypothetical protein